MHAFYCRSALLILGQELARGNYSVQRFARIINSLIIAEAEARPLVPGWRAFTNLNTPEDYRRFRAGAAAMQIIKEYEIVRIQTDLARSLRDLVIVEFALRLKVNGRNHTNFFVHTQQPQRVGLRPSFFLRASFKARRNLQSL